jgi:hypothetical protein
VPLKKISVAPEFDKMNILNIQEPILLDDIIPPVENIEILKHLSIRDFKIQHEDDKEESKFKCAFVNNVRHVGFALLTKDVSVPNLNTDPFDPLFLWARMITSIITYKLKIESFKKIYRIHWNYYYGDQQGIGHIDRPENNFISILYNPHTTDGGTEILNKFYPDKIGQAKIFKSNWNHKGICVKKDKARASLNIILEY